MTRETADWLSRIGIILGFVSFWFVAPEFIGEARLKQWERALSRVILKLPFAAKAAMAIVFSGAALLYVYRFIITGRTDTISRTTLVTMGITSMTAIFFEVLRPSLHALANHDHVRQRALFVGGLLFTISTALQFIATFQTAFSH
jgi:hypothetical protein